MELLYKINSKADAMVFAFEKSYGDIEKAEQIYRLFADNIQLPDTEMQMKESFVHNTVRHLLETAKSGNQKNESEEIPVQGI